MTDLLIAQIPEQPQHQLVSIDFTADIQYKHLPEVRDKLGFATSPVIQARTSRFPIVVNQYDTGAWGSTWLLIFRVAANAWRAIVVSDKLTPPAPDVLASWVREVHTALRIFNGEVTSKVVVGVA